MSKYRIQTVAQITGLSPALIRAWEARYSLVTPARTAAGYRLYSDEDVAVLQGAQRLIQRGMAPMEIARLPRQKLREAIGPGPGPGETQLQAGAGLNLDANANANVNVNVNRGWGAEASSRAPLSYAERIDRLIAAFATFDAPQVEALLGPPLALLPPDVACRELLMPLLREVGERWHRGELTVASEHFGTSYVSGLLKTLIETLRSRSVRPGPGRLLLGCPPGELHELGLLMFTLDAVTQGWDVVYLGANVPLADLASAAQTTRPDLVGLSLVLRRDPAELAALLGHVRQALGERFRVLVGGSGIVGQTAVVRGAGCLMLPESGRLDDLLRPPN